MANPVRIDFGTQSDPGRYGPETGPRHINAYVEKTEEGAPPLPIYCSPGLDTFATVSGGGACRGALVVDNNIVALSGNKLARLDGGGTVTEIGTITGNQPAIMARNAASNPQVVLTMDGNIFLLNSTFALSAYPDTDVPPANSVFFLDQRVVFTIPDGRLFWSEIDNAASVDALSFSTAEGAPDGLVRGFGHRLDGWLFGAETTEIWRATSNPDQPFLRAGGGFIPKGCSAPFAVASLGDMIFWIGDDDIPYTAPGYSLQPLIHGPVCRAIKDTPDKTDITGFTYYEGGYGFWEITGPTWTWVYCATTNKWFEKQAYGMARSRARFGVRFNGQTIVGGDADGAFYKLNSETFTENGGLFVWTLRSSPMHAYPKRISVDRLYVDLITGVGLNSSTEDEKQPKIMLRWSDDGGRTFSRTMTKGLGELGHYDQRIVFNNLGTTGRQGRIWELSVSSPVVRGLRYAAVEGDLIGT